MHQEPGKPYTVRHIEHMAPSENKDALLRLGYRYAVVQWDRPGQALLRTIAYYRCERSAIRRMQDCNAA